MAVRIELASTSERSAESTSWSTVEEYLKRDDRVILPVGSQEQHGRHMPLGVDWMIPHALGHRVSAATGVLCLSPVCYGMAWLHSGFPGTVALKVTTLIAVYTDILEELYAQGFRRVLLLNGHGGNGNAIIGALSGLVRKFEDLRVKVREWWRLPAIEELCIRELGACDSHAGPAETSVMLHLFSAAVDMSAASDNASEILPFFANPGQIRELYPDGVMQNNATRANAAAGKKIVDLCVGVLAGEVSIGGSRGAW